MEACNNKWISFLTYATPGTSREDVKSRFEPLLLQNPGKAFLHAMMIGNLREGGGGRADMKTFMACMEVIWDKKPHLIIANIKFIMMDVSCKMGLILLKHFSNLDDEENTNNYWGNLAAIENKKQLRLSFRPNLILQERRQLPIWAGCHRAELLSKAQQAADEAQLRRKRRFDAHGKVLQEFVESLAMPGVIDDVFQIVQPKAAVKDKTYNVLEDLWHAKCLEVQQAFTSFAFELARKDELEDELAQITWLSEGAMLLCHARAFSVARWFEKAEEEDAHMEWAALFRYGSSWYERNTIMAEFFRTDRKTARMMGSLHDSTPRSCLMVRMQDASENKILNAYIRLELPPSFLASDFIISQFFPEKDSYETQIDWESESIPYCWMCPESIMDCRYGAKGLSCCFPKECNVSDLNDEWDLDDWEEAVEEDDVRVSANAVVGGGIRRKFLSKEQIKRKKQRNDARKEAFEASLVKKDPLKKERAEFVHHLCCNPDLASKLAADPIQEISFEGDDEETRSVNWCDLEEHDVFEKRVGKVVAVKPCKTRMNMNSLCGFQVVPELEKEFRDFLEKRDKAYAAQMKASKKLRLNKERSAPSRASQKLEDLFEAVADAFVELLEAGHPFAFKYCPTPGCSADKATGSCEGIASAVMRKMGFPGHGLDDHGRLFKSFIAAHRELHNVAESHFGSRRFKQVNLKGLPAMHARLFLGKVHAKFNPEGYHALMRKVSACINSAHIQPHLLLNDAEFNLDPVAEKQFLSMITKTKPPRGMDIMPVVDVSGSMTGTPMEVAIALGLIVSYCQCKDPAAAYQRLFLTFSSSPQLYELPEIVQGGVTFGTLARWLRKKPWGGSTNFNASMRLMLNVLKKKYPEGTSRKQILMIFTDMQFDCADGKHGYVTNYAQMQRDFRAAGYPTPTVVFWNIRGDVWVGAQDGLPAAPDRKGVVCLSGYNADLLQDFFGMISRGEFAEARGDAEEDPCVESMSKLDRLSTNELHNLVETSPMYQRYNVSPDFVIKGRGSVGLISGRDVSDVSCEEIQKSLALYPHCVMVKGSQEQLWARFDELDIMTYRGSGYGFSKPVHFNKPFKTVEMVIGGKKYVRVGQAQSMFHFKHHFLGDDFIAKEVLELIQDKHAAATPEPSQQLLLRSRGGRICLMPRGSKNISTIQGLELLTAIHEDARAGCFVIEGTLESFLNRREELCYVPLTATSGCFKKGNIESVSFHHRNFRGGLDGETMFLCFERVDYYQEGEFTADVLNQFILDTR